MPNYRYVCEECQEIQYIIFKFEERPDIIGCRKCHRGEAHYQFDAPSVLNHTVPDSASRGKHYSQIKDYAKLKKIEADLPLDKRADIQKEIKKIEQI